MLNFILSQLRGICPNIKIKYQKAAKTGKLGLADGKCVNYKACNHSKKFLNGVNMSSLVTPFLTNKIYVSRIISYNDHNAYFQTKFQFFLIDVFPLRELGKNLTFFLSFKLLCLLTKQFYSANDLIQHI